MRALVAAFLALGLVLTVAVPHVHAAGHGGSECAVCVARHGDVARSETPDLAPQVLHAEPVQMRPAFGPVTGAPLGAVPGQSPPP
ncbi:MAG TPA: hypothetical protein VIW03_10750 [Anaeromyxobacter sp.]